MPELLCLMVAAAVLLLPLAWAIVTYNRFQRLAQHLRESWSQIDVELKRRHDLIPNLAETVRGYARHERETLDRLVELRNRAETDRQQADAGGRRGGQGAGERATATRTLGEDESQVGRQLRQLFAVAEGYPQLRSDAHFLQLQRELALTEDRLAAARRFYNANVRELNALCRSFPSNLIAGPAGAEEAAYFELASDAERTVPRV